MSDQTIKYADMKRRIRKLKKLELKIRFGCSTLMDKPDPAKLVWDDFFNLQEVNAGKGRYTLRQICAMDKATYKQVIDEFFFYVYYRFYQENGILNTQFYDPDILEQLELPLQADYPAIKKRFRELAMKYHPDTGGDVDKFIELMENYKKLIH
ncbi:MAG: J domain-containing protein [Clostridiaceae bacterium]|nr:J domain-containing protein [Clostridiaceae bacterium]